MTADRKERKVMVVKGLSCPRGSLGVEGCRSVSPCTPVACGKVCFMFEVQGYRGQPPPPQGDAAPYPAGPLRVPSGLSVIFQCLQCQGGVVSMPNPRRHTVPCWVPEVPSGLSAVFQGDGGGKRTRRDAALSSCVTFVTTIRHRMLDL
jgi:hypothetical protein